MPCSSGRPASGRPRSRLASATLAEAEADLAANANENGKLEEELRARVARLHSELEQRQERQDELARELEHASSGSPSTRRISPPYVDDLKDTFRERDAEWWAKQLGSEPAILG